MQLELKMLFLVSRVLSSCSCSCSCIMKLCVSGCRHSVHVVIHRHWPPAGETGPEGACHELAYKACNRFQPPEINRRQVLRR